MESFALDEDEVVSIGTLEHTEAALCEANSTASAAGAAMQEVVVPVPVIMMQEVVRQVAVPQVFWNVMEGTWETYDCRICSISSM